MTGYPLNEQKLVYRVLHGSLTSQPDLMDCQFLDDLQKSLQDKARAEGVDITDHQAWDRWLGNPAVGCVVRMERRQTIG